MVPKTMPSSEEAVQVTIDKLKVHLDYYKEHQREQLLIGNLIDASLRLASQLCVINVIKFGQCETYSQVAKELEKRDTKVTSDVIARYAKATITPEIEILVALYHLSEEKTKTVWQARQERTPSEGYRGGK